MKKIRVTDYIANFIYKKGIEEVFMLTGGGAMFLDDGVAKHPKLKAICNHHEQACAMGAVGYAKYKGLAAAYFTTGCGGTNAVTGLLDAWQDNVSCLFFSGQVKRKETTRNSGLKLRGFGVQEADIIPIVESISKYAVMVNDPLKIAYHLEKAYFLATTGRKGPVWIDVPMDIQSARIEEDKLEHFNPYSVKSVQMIPSTSQIDLFKSKLETAQRPVILAGNGIRLSGAVEEFKAFIHEYNIPVVVTYLGIDFLQSTDPLFVGRAGTKGDRAGNFALQNSDLILSIGCRLCVSVIGFEYDLFAREAELLVVDIDEEEHKKDTVKIDHFLQSDAKEFFQAMPPTTQKADQEWVDKCLKWRDQWPICLPEYKNEKDGINMYFFMDQLSNQLRKDDVVVSDAGSAIFVVSQSLKIYSEQRYITSGGQADMGFSIPAAIGACIAKKSTDVIAITGDGSFQLNIQELQTIVYLNLPIKIFVWNNNGYLSIRASQQKFFEGRFIGTDSSNGVSFPELEKIADAYGIKFNKVSNNSELKYTIEQVLNFKGPVLCEVIVPPDQAVIPVASSSQKTDGTIISKPLEDMFPFLDRKTFYSEMLVKPVKE
jgi:acetolactate synthase I/II/III large subunit